MQFVIRQLEQEHDADVNRLSQQLGYALELTKTAEQVQQILSRNDHVAFVAISNDEVTGWIHAFQAFYLESLPFVEIGGLVVDKKHRGKGVGKALICEIKEWCLQQRVYRLRVRTQTKRLDAQQFYASFGFKQVKEQKVYQLELSWKENDHQE